MLSHEDNELLVRVGAGTPMGKLMRLYWIPFLLARDVPADGLPYRVRLLGYDAQRIAGLAEGGAFGTRVPRGAENPA
ncbi:MAG TPA: hypothetical protein PK306_27830 [Aquabacterium sp.]|nr:hypothetical protein [Aquabacterium sp.]HQC99523.1 hypothetical protein [Aquabacterium sp.]